MAGTLLRADRRARELLIEFGESSSIPARFWPRWIRLALFGRCTSMSRFSHGEELLIVTYFSRESARFN